MRERALIADLLAPLATHRAARGLQDDAAVWLPPLGREVVLTHDTLAEGVHYLPHDPPSDVAWKLLAVNLSDLAAMGAAPVGVLLGLTLGAACDDDWVRGFVAGLARGLAHFEIALLGGDTVSWRGGCVLGLTAVGTVERGCALGRGGASVGDAVWVSGTIGDAGLGLAAARGHTFDASGTSPSSGGGGGAADGGGLRARENPLRRFAPPPPEEGEEQEAVRPDRQTKHLLTRYRRPDPRLALGRALIGTATACMDISDGLLIDAERLAAASGVGIALDLTALPVSPAAAARTPANDAGRLDLASAGDDYELLFTAPPHADAPALATTRVPLTRVGIVVAGAGLTVTGDGGTVLTPTRLGYEH